MRRGREEKSCRDKEEERETVRVEGRAGRSGNGETVRGERKRRGRDRIMREGDRVGGEMRCEEWEKGGWDRVR